MGIYIICYICLTDVNIESTNGYKIPILMATNIGAIKNGNFHEMVFKEKNMIIRPFNNFCLNMNKFPL